MTTIDINTAETPQTLTIQDDKELCDIVYAIASKQLVINAAEANQQLKIEAAKKAFEDGTAEFSAGIKTLFAAVQAYAEANKDRLFPVKNGTRKKTFAILQHKLQYRSADRVEAPSDAVQLILKAVETVNEYESPDGCWNGMPCGEIEQILTALIRTPAPEINKDAVKVLAAKEDPALKELTDWLRLNGLRVVTDETFKLAFAFTPEQSAN